MSWKASAYVKSLIVCPNGERILRNEKLVALVLADSHQDKSNAYTFPSVDGIAEDSLMSKRECQRVLASLEVKGVILRVRPSVQYRGINTFYSFPELDKEGRQPVTLPEQKGGEKGGQKGDRRVTKTASYIEEQEQELEPKTKPPSTSKKKPFELPKWVNADAWAAFLEMRKKINKPATDEAMRLLVMKLERFEAQGHNHMTVLEQSIVGCYQDVYEPKEKIYGGRGSTANNKITQATENARAVLERRRQNRAGTDGDVRVPGSSANARVPRTLLEAPRPRVPSGGLGIVGKTG